MKFDPLESSVQNKDMSISLRRYVHCTLSSHNLQLQGAR